MTTVFLSYTASDRPFVQELRKRLIEWGHETWMDVHNIPKGARRWPDEVDKGLRQADVLLGIMTPDALASDNVKNEWDWAIARKKPLILLRLKPCDIPAHYISINYIDFSLDEVQGFTELRKDLTKRSSLEKSRSLSPEIQTHLEKYWQLSRKFFEQSDYALAAFFALVLFDEIGTTILIGFPHTLSKNVTEKNLTPNMESQLIELSETSRADRRKLTVGMTLQVNSRVTRIYKELESEFAKWYRQGELPVMCNHALYMHGSNLNVIVPKQAISQRDAYILVCMVGEVYAEIQGEITGTTPDEWQRILMEVDEFREANSDSTALS